MKQLSVLGSHSRLGLTLLVGALLAVAIAFGFAAGDPAEASPCWGIERTYYNNAAHSQVVGQVIWPCVGGRQTWGQVSPYVEIFSEDCGTCFP